MSVESSSSCPLTLTTGTLAAAYTLATTASFIQELTCALAGVAEYVVNQESSSDANYADRALVARLIADNPYYWANNLAYVVALDQADLSGDYTDQALINRVWTLWPVISYKMSSFTATGSEVSSEESGD